VVGGAGLKREYPTQPVVGVGALIVHEGKLLIVKRGVEPAKGKWSIPGGAVELGERIRDALVREVKEECGLDVEIALKSPMDAIDNIIISRDGRLQYHYVLLQFLARLKGGTLKPASDVLDARWVLLDEVEKYNLTKSFRSFFKKHQEELIRT
jgi:8-oxo-dGTP diphosphatase